MDNTLTLLKDAEQELVNYKNGKPTTQMVLSLVRAANNALMWSENVGEVKDIRDKLNGIETYIKQQKADLISSNAVVAQRLRTERALGQMIPDEFPAHRPEKVSLRVTLNDYGISRNQSSRWQRIASIDEDDFELWVQEMLEKEEITTAALLRFFMNLHVSDDSYEWNTPKDIIEAARLVMGSIDTDPATNVEAQEFIQADTYYTAEDDGLSQPWYGNVWLNPPYNMPYVELFVDRAINDYEADLIGQVIILVNNSTDTGWFHKMLRKYPVCFSKGRLQFWNGSETLAARQGQAIFYLGDNSDLFADVFSEFGEVLKKYDD